MSQSTEILSHLQSGHALTPLDALRMFGCFRLSGRILDLRSAGHDIVTDMVEVNGKHVASYRLRQRELFAA